MKFNLLLPLLFISITSYTQPDEAKQKEFIDIVTHFNESNISYYKVDSNRYSTHYYYSFQYKHQGVSYYVTCIKSKSDPINAMISQISVMRMGDPAYSLINYNSIEQIEFDENNPSQIIISWVDFYTYVVDFIGK